MKNQIKGNNGITLIALVITIIVLLILAGVVIQTLTGDNGLLIKVQQAKEENEEAKINEQIRLTYSEWQVAKHNGDTKTAAEFMQEKLKITLDDNGLTVRDNLGMYIVRLSNKKIYRLEINAQDILNDNTKNYVGHYADIDEDGEVDGIIFVDLLTGSIKTKQAWNSTTYTLPANVNTSNVKSYYISQQNYDGAYGVKDVISPKGTGEERFYIMSLNDFTSEAYTDEENEANSYPSYTIYRWYRYGYGKLDPQDTSINFGTGKTNTKNILEKWNSKAYGNQDNQDIWKHIQTKVDNGWFVPSKEEWAAYANELGPSATYGSLAYGIQNYYWSSSILESNNAWTASFAYGYPAYKGIGDTFHVRMGTTF